MTDHPKSINNFDIDGACSDFQPCDSRMLSQHKVYVDAFRAIYPINNGIAANAAVATGRYPEDTYYGGNPWYLCTLSAAELLYDAAAQFRRQGRLVIDNVSLAFFQQIYPNATIGTYQAPAQYCPGGPWWGNWGMSTWGGHTWGKPSRFPPYPGPPNQQNLEFNDILTAMTNYADGTTVVLSLVASLLISSRFRKHR